MRYLLSRGRLSQHLELLRSSPKVQIKQPFGVYFAANYIVRLFSVKISALSTLVGAVRLMLTTPVNIVHFTT